jgi:hypothetical protein
MDLNLSTSETEANNARPIFFSEMQYQKKQQSGGDQHFVVTLGKHFHEPSSHLPDCQPVGRSFRSGLRCYCSVMQCQVRWNSRWIDCRGRIRPSGVSSLSRNRDCWFGVGHSSNTGCGQI